MQTLLLKHEIRYSSSKLLLLLNYNSSYYYCCCCYYYYYQYYYYYYYYYYYTTTTTTTTITTTTTTTITTTITTTAAATTIFILIQCLSLSHEIFYKGYANIYMQRNHTYKDSSMQPFRHKYNLLHAHTHIHSGRWQRFQIKSLERPRQDSSPYFWS